MKIPVPETLLPAEQLGAVHFIGIGGAGLSAIARIMARTGVAVTGSDDNETPFLAPLRELGITCHIGYDAAHLAHLGPGDSVVITTAAREDNPEVLAAQQRGLRLLPRSAGLAAVMRSAEAGRVVCVAGTHGKTTTTSLLTVALLGAGADPTYAVGGVLSATGRNADAGSGGIFVAEADESDGAFLVYRPSVAVVTNIDADHLDQWGTVEAYQAAFTAFADRIDDALIVHADSPQTRALAQHARDRGLRVLTYGESADADYSFRDWSTEGGRSSFVVTHGGADLAAVSLQIPGRHYVHNAVAAMATGIELGCAADRLAAGLADFTGTGRRMEPKGEVAGVRVYDSYAHHPSEIVGDLEAARSLVSDGGRVLVAFQPHLVSRTRIFGSEMGTALSAADEVVVLDIYVAREDPDPAVTSELVAAAIELPPAAVARVSGVAEAAHELASRARPGDVLLTLGAGTITEAGPLILTHLEAGH